MCSADSGDTLGVAMSRSAGNAVPLARKPANLMVARSIRQFSEARRNVVRGTVAAALRGTLGSGKIDALRDNHSESDMVAAANILESPGGLRNRKVVSLTDRDLPIVHRSTRKSAALEAAYACGFLNAWAADAKRAIKTIALLSQITRVPEKDGLTALLAAVRSWGASSYISRKVTYAKEFFEEDAASKATLGEIDALLEHKKIPNIQFYALEILKDNISLFTVTRRHTNILQKLSGNDFRKALSLNGLVATPINESDCSGYLLRAVETSLIDTVHAVWVIMNLGDRFPNITQTIERYLDSSLLTELRQAFGALAAESTPVLVAPPPSSDESIVLEEDGNQSLQLYRRSASFLEFPSFCRFRNDIDRVVGFRLMAPMLPDNRAWHAPDFSDKTALQRADSTFDLALHGQPNVKIDTFYRTYLFLRFIQDPYNLALLDNEDIQYIFDNTMGLESLILERELKTMHLNAAEDARALISVLAMALYRAKSSDPDIDFDFRSKLEDYIQSNFGGKIAAFIDHLAPKSPQVANYIVTSLDEATLQKMYSIIGSLAGAEEARREILTTVGIHLNNIDYIVEAEAIETRAKVSKLKEYFDTSRMFVDSIAMKKWLSTNPSAYTQQFKEKLPELTARYSVSKNIVTSAGNEKRLDFFHITTTEEYLVSEMAKEAFREFCVSNEFGIESYLGRRIRHNTLQGVMTKSTDAVLQRSEHQPIIAGTPFGRALASWESAFKIYIERMRKEFLQFKTESKPNALFNSEMDLTDPVTMRNIQQLVQTLKVSGLEMLDELIVSFCWRQVAPQLEAASRQIRVKMVQEVVQALDQSLSRFEGPEERKIKAALTDAISSVFAQVASWFQLPQTGFVPASIADICNIIDMDNGRPALSTVVTGDYLSTKYYGISVHRLYDCLAVLLQNAFKHGNTKSDVIVHVTATPLEGANLHLLTVGVESSLPPQSDLCVARVEAAVTSSDTGKEMVTEGYSGIKKVKFITRLNEGSSTVTYQVTNQTIRVAFSLKAEVVDQEDGIENTPR